jgi:hypothetical protein
MRTTRLERREGGIEPWGTEEWQLPERHCLVGGVWLGAAAEDEGRLWFWKMLLETTCCSVVGREE